MTGRDTSPPVQPMTEATSRVLIAVLAIFTGAGLLAIAFDRQQIVAVLQQADWRPLPLALAATGVSYLAMSAALVAISELLGVSAPRSQLLRAAFISESLNHVVSLGGVAGYSLRTAVVTRLNVSAGDIIAMSLLHSYLNNLALAVLLGIGTIVLTTRGVLAAPWLAMAQLLGAIVAVFSAISTAALFSKRARRPLIQGSLALARRFPHGWRPGSERAVMELDAALTRGWQSVRQRPARSILPAVLIAAHWCGALAAFWFCLDAFGEAASLPVVLSGFSIGVAAGFVAVVPGGLGVQEGTLAGAFTVLGVPLAHAALAAVLFRALYYFLPYLFSLTLYAGAARGGPGRGGPTGTPTPNSP